MLPSSWVDALFSKLGIRYGADWLRKWEGFDIAAVKADWAAELGGFADKPAALKHALGNLPADRPPSVAQFRALCLQAPIAVLPALPAPPADPEAAERVRALGVTIGGADPKAWAHLLRRRELACERLTAAQRAAWRDALRPEMAAERDEVAA